MKKLLSFSLWHGVGHSDFSPESNTFYLLHYESYFDEVYQVFLIGEHKETITFNKTTFVFLGTGNNKLDVLMAPFRLYKFTRKLKPTTFLTYEQIWLWWITWIVKLLLKAKVNLLPITIPSVMHNVTRKSLSVILPLWLEKLLISLSYRAADQVLTTHGFGNYVDWLSSERFLKSKLKTVAVLPEATPPPFFFESIKKLKDLKSENENNDSDAFNLIYVGRLHREKLVDHLIKMMPKIKESNPNIHLSLVGDGSEVDYLRNLSIELEVDDVVSFMGYISNGNLPGLLMKSDAFVSPLTGCSLREAALCGLPILAYDMDWVSKILKHDYTALLVPSGKYSQMADEVLRLSKNKELSETLAKNVADFAWETWSPQHMHCALSEAFESI